MLLPLLKKWVIKNFLLPWIAKTELERIFHLMSKVRCIAVHSTKDFTRH